MAFKGLLEWGFHSKDRIPHCGLFQIVETALMSWMPCTHACYKCLGVILNLKILWQPSSPCLCISVSVSLPLSHQHKKLKEKEKSLVHTLVYHVTNLSLFNKKRNFQPITLNGWGSEMVIKNRTFHQKHEVQVYFQLKQNYSCDQQMWALRRQIFAAATLELWQSRRIKLPSAISLRCSVCLLVYDGKKKKKKECERERETCETCFIAWTGLAYLTV